MTLGDEDFVGVDIKRAAIPTGLFPFPIPSGARHFRRIANICEKDMSFVTTSCVAGRIGEHGGYVGFRA
jgi:hypothetical protein